MAVVMIGIDPHKASHTAVAISAAEEPLGELWVRACAAQAERLLAWAAAWPQRTWAVEGAGGLGHLLAQQLLGAGERVLDVQPKLGARVRLLTAGDSNKNDPNGARSVAIAALRSAGVREVRRDDHAAVLKIWSKRYRDLGRTRTQVACRLHAVLCELIPGGVSKAITAPAAARLLESIAPAGAVEAARCELAAAFARGPAWHRRPDPPDQGQARRRDPGDWDEPDRAVRGRAGHRRRCHRRRPRRVPLSRPGPLRRLQRDRADRGVLRPAQDLPAVPAREPAAQPRHPHGRGHSGPPLPQRGPRVLRQEAGRGQDAERSPALAEAPGQQRHLRLPAGRRPAGRSARRGPGRAAGERLCRQRGRLAPQAPALRTSHSRARSPPYDRGRQPRAWSCSRPGHSWPFLDRCHTAAGDAAGPGGEPAAQRGRTTWRYGKTTAALGREEGQAKNRPSSHSAPKAASHAAETTDGTP